MVARSLAALAALVMTLALAGCGGPRQSNPANTLNIIAGSEVSDLAPYFPQIQKATGVTIVPTYSGTLAGIDRILGGEEHFDGAWFSHAKYLVLSDTQHLIKAQERIMLSPVVLGVKESRAKAFGWVGNPNVSWKDVAARIHAHQLTFAMTNPTTSNSGFSAVIGIASAFAGTSDALKVSDVDAAKLTDFFSGQKLTAGSSGWLADAFVRDQDHLDGMINYESILISLNHGAQLKEPLTLIYPKEGVVTADYPFVLLNDAKSAAYQKVVAYLKTPEFQRVIMEKTYRRPVDPSIALSSDFPKNLVLDLPFPGSIATIDGILLRFLNVNRVPPHSFFLIDTSGSMQGKRLNSVREAFYTLAGSDLSITGRFARFENREEITVITFNDQALPPVDFAMHSAQDPATLTAVKQFADGLQAGGNTAIYDAIESALAQAAKAKETDKGHYPSIVLMTDGENNRGDTVGNFEEKYAAMPAELRSIKVFPIFIGEANPDELKHIADLTGGREFDARNESLPAIFKEIRGYQ